jgi:RimJ/RimL family protein N-acetyltransferase
MNHSIFDPIIIDTPKLKIRPLSAVSWQKIADGVLYDGSFHSRMWGMTTPEDIKKSYESSLMAFENKKGNPLVFLSLDESEVYGKTNFMNVEPHNKMLEIGGTWIGQKWQRTFVNTISKYELLKYCFEKLDLKRVEFRIDSENVVSQKAIERIGAKYEGLLRNRTINATGKCRDYKFYSVIDLDWPILKPYLEKKIYDYKG